MYTTYILFSKKLNKYYTGHTDNIIRRIEEHNRGKSSFSAKGVPWIIVFQKDFSTRQEASQLESKIKKRGAKRYLTDNDMGLG